MRWWPHVRATLIALAIALGLVDGCPGPRNGAEQRIAEQRLGPGLAGVVSRLERTRARVLRPLRPATDLFGLRQRWKLFAGAARKRYRMAIEVRDAGETTWRLVYRPHDDDHDYRAAQIGYRRLRGAWNPHSTYGARGGYAIFVRWIADRIFAEEPRADGVRVRMERIEIGAHGDYTATGEQAYELKVTRAERAAVRAWWRRR